jgi:hypothetical protein
VPGAPPLGRDSTLNQAVLRACRYPYERALKGSNHVKAWRDHRFAKHYPGFEVQVLNASGHVAHGGTLLTTVRDTYLDA